MSERQPRELGTALRRGAGGRCPQCGKGRLFDGFLTLRDICEHCGFGIRRHAPAAGPAFLSIATASLFLVPVLGLTAALFGPNPAILAMVGLAILPLLAVVLLRVIKGAMVGYLWVFDVDSGPRTDPPQGRQVPGFNLRPSPTDGAAALRESREVPRMVAEPCQPSAVDPSPQQQHKESAMQTRHSSPPAKPLREIEENEALPLDEIAGEAIPPTVPPVETAQDDDEGGADPIDPDTGRPYPETDPGTATPAAERRGGASEG